MFLTITICISAFIISVAVLIEIMYPGFFKDLIFNYVPRCARKATDKYNKSISERKQIEKECRVSREYAAYLQERGNETLINKSK